MSLTTTTTTVPSTVTITRRHLLGLAAATMAATAGLTWGITALTTSADAAHAPSVRTRAEVLASLDPAARQFVAGVTALSPLQLAAAYGNKPLDALQLDASSKQYVEGISALSPEQIQAGFGRNQIGPSAP